MPASLEVYVTAQRHFRVGVSDADGVVQLSSAMSGRIERAFLDGQGAGLLHLATEEVKSTLPPGLAFARRFAQRYVADLCHLGDVGSQPDKEWVAAPADEELSALALEAPPLKGLEYLDSQALHTAWLHLDAQVRQEAGASGRGPREWLHERNPLWRLIGRVTFHLAENKGDEEYPFAFLATYAASVSSRGEAQHIPLGRALKEYAGAANRKRLVQLLSPIRDAAESLTWVRELIESGDIYQPLAWTPAEAHEFLRDVPPLEASGLVVRIPDWWKPERPRRPQVSARVGTTEGVSLGAGALLDFSVALTLEGADGRGEARAPFLGGRPGQAARAVGRGRCREAVGGARALAASRAGGARRRDHLSRGDAPARRC